MLRSSTARCGLGIARSTPHAVEKRPEFAGLVTTPEPGAKGWALEEEKTSTILASGRLWGGVPAKPGNRVSYYLFT